MEVQATSSLALGDAEIGINASRSSSTTGLDSGIPKTSSSSLAPSPGVPFSRSLHAGAEVVSAKAPAPAPVSVGTGPLPLVSSPQAPNHGDSLSHPIQTNVAAKGSVTEAPHRSRFRAAHMHYKPDERRTKEVSPVPNHGPLMQTIITSGRLLLRPVRCLSSFAVVCGLVTKPLLRPRCPACTITV